MSENSNRSEASIRELMIRRRMQGGLPHHLAIVMDGNRRYAKSLGYPTAVGHWKGKERLEQMIRWVLCDLRIPCLTVYALSLENLSNRRPEEVEQLVEVIGRGLDELCNSQDIRDFDIRVQIVGSRDALPPRLRQAADGVEQHTANSTSGGVLTICLAYGGRQDLVEAARRTAVDYASGRLKECDITDQALSQRLWTSALPDADLVIRTSGEERISNFLLWQIAYAELFFSPLPWPAFDSEALLAALEHYAQRSRRFGA